MKKAVIVLVLVLLVGSLLALAEQQGQEEQECWFLCQLGKFLSGEGREKVVGEIP